MSHDDHRRRKGRQAVDVIAVAVRQHDVGHRQGRQLRDFGEHLARRLGGRLRVDDNHARLADDIPELPPAPPCAQYTTGASCLMTRG